MRHTALTIALSIVLVMPVSHLARQHTDDPSVNVRSNGFPRKQLKTAIDYIARGKYDLAIKYAEDNLSDTLSVKFISLSALYARLGELETTVGQEDFFYEVETIVNLTKAGLEHDPEDITALFYLGSALSYRSVIHKNSGSIWKAFKDARSGNKLLKECVVIDPDFPEPHLFLGSYTYWMSKINIIRYVPFVPDNRKKGVDEIVSHLNPESVSYAMGLNQLFWIAMDMKNFDEAEKILIKGLALYPESRFFLYPAANLAQKQGDWFKAALYFNRVKKSLETDGYTNRYMWLKVTLKQAESYVQAKQYEKALRLCSEIASISVLPSEIEKSKRLFQRAKAITKRYSPPINN